MRAIWKGEVIATSADTVLLEGNHYFPRGALKAGLFRESEHTTRCGWKGTARYFDVIVGEHVNENAAWYYETPKEAAEQIAGRVAFWRGIVVVS